MGPFRLTRYQALAVTALALLQACAGGEGSPPPAVAAVCGNSVPEGGEECDDGNPNEADGCLSTCQTPVAFTASDVHAHSTGCSHPVTPAELAVELKRQQIQVGAALVWGWDFDAAAVHFTGRDHPVSTPGFILHYDLEISRLAAARTGHLLLLGLDSLAFSADVFNLPQSGVPVVDWARRQPRAVVGMAHGQYWPRDGSFPIPPGGCCVPWEVVVHAARGRLDFLSVERPLAEEPGAFRLWKAMQNAGLRVAITGGSDWSCLTERFGDTTMRTDVIVDGPLTYESWLRAIKAGRTTAAHGVGDRLNVRVDGRRMGEEVRLAAAGAVSVTVETAGRGGEVEILVNGEPVARRGVGPGLQLARADVMVTRSSWIAARSPNAQTSPVYVLVGDQPVRGSAEDVCYLWRAAEYVQDLATSRRLPLFASTEEGLLAYGEAIGELRRRFTEAGGLTCR